MKRFLLGAALVTLAACVTPTGEMAPKPAEGMQLATQSDMAAIVGKRLTFASGQYLTVTADGKITGAWDGQTLTGTYEMRDGYVCREISIRPGEDCQLWILNGNEVIGSRDRGNGAQFTYTVS